MKKAMLILAIILSLIAGSVLTYGLTQMTRRIPTYASLKVVGIGIYKDVDFTVSVTEINWGILEAGEQKNFLAYIKNESNVPITLTMLTEEWNPQNASSFITLSWDYDESVIDVDGSIPITFTLNISPAVVGINSFSFTIVIVGSG